MKICILYDSKYGIGKGCVEYLGSYLKDRGNQVEIYSIKDIKSKSIPEVDAYIFSAPTHFGNVSLKMKGYLNKIREKEGKRYAVMTTCLGPESKAVDTMEGILDDKGMKKISNGLKIKVNSMKGPAEEGHEKELKKFADEIMKPI
jgi:flavorubredoxin